MRSTAAEIAPPLLADAARRLGIGRAHRHVFLCAGATTPKCCPGEESLVVWRHLKSRLRDLGVEGGVHRAQGGGDGEACVLRNKVDCLRICKGGPIAVVYPEGIWYGGVTVPVLDRIIDEHVLAGFPVQEHVIVAAALRPAAPRPATPDRGTDESVDFRQGATPEAK